MDQSTFNRKVWLGLLKDTLSTPGYHYIENHFKREDLLTLIAEGDEVAGDLLLHNAVRSNGGNKFWRIADELLPANGSGQDFDPDYLNVLTDLLRFSKRYVPEGMQNKHSIEDFASVNARCKAYDIDDHSYIVGLVASYATEWLEDWADHVPQDNFLFSRGSDLERHKTLLEKLYHFEKSDSQFLASWMSYIPEGEPEADIAEYVNHMTAVPKNYKGPRWIAAESQSIYAPATCLASAIKDCLPAFVSIDDQDRNQELCLEASITRLLDSLDLHAASDSVACSLVRGIVPRDLYLQILHLTAVGPKRGCYEWRDPYTREIRHSVKTRWGYWHHTSDTLPIKASYGPVIEFIPVMNSYGMISTMGNPLTFVLEELVFAAAIAAAITLTGRYWEDYVDQLAVYGDDMIVPGWLTPTLIDVLTVLGFEVNTDKSCVGDIPYRESCGVEFYNGHDVTSTYWPRREFDLDRPSMLIDLQHKLYKYPTCNDLLCRMLRKKWPGITESFPGSPYDDIWDPYPHIEVANCSYSDDTIDQSLEVHTMVQTRYRALNKADDRFPLSQWLKNPDALFEPEDFVEYILHIRPRVDRISYRSIEKDEKLVRKRFLI